jgi:hypothetical protein
LHHKKVQKKLFSFAKGIVQHAGEAWLDYSSRLHIWNCFCRNMRIKNKIVKYVLVDK